MAAVIYNEGRTKVHATMVEFKKACRNLSVKPASVIRLAETPAFSGLALQPYSVLDSNDKEWL